MALEINYSTEECYVTAGYSVKAFTRGKFSYKTVLTLWLRWHIKASGRIRG